MSRTSENELLAEGKLRRLIELSTQSAFFQYDNGHRGGYGDSKINQAMFVANEVRRTLEEFGVLRERDPSPTLPRQKRRTR